MKIVLLILFAGLCIPHSVMADRVYENCVLTGWTEEKAHKLIHYAVHITYHPPSREHPYLSSGGIRSIEVRYANATVDFPPDSFNDCSVDWGTPSYFGYSEYGKCYQLMFYNCGDAAKSYEMEFVIRGGRLIERHLIPAQISELEDRLLRFNRTGTIIYNGPCDRQGKPILSPQRSDKFTPTE